MEIKAKNKKVISICLVTVAIIIALIGFKIMILDEDATNIAGAKTVREIGLEEEKKIFGLEEKEVEKEKIETTAQMEPITVTKAIACGNNENIQIGQIQTYYITVKNNTDAELKNISVKDEIPEELTYVEEITGEGYESRYEEKSDIKEYKNTIEKLEAREEIELKYSARVKTDAEIGKKIGTKAVATIQRDTKQYESNLIENTIKESKLQIELTTPELHEEYYRPDDYITLFAKVKNISKEELKDITISCKLSEKENYISSEYLIKNEEGAYEEESSRKSKQGEYNKENREAVWKINSLGIDEECAVKLLISLENKTTDENMIKIKNVFTAMVNEEKYGSNVFDINQLNKSKVNVKLSVNPENKVFYEKDEFEYIVTIDMPEASSERVNLKAVLPDGLIGKEIIYSMSNNEESKISFNGDTTIQLTFEESKSKTVRLKVKADELENGVEEKQIKNQIVISGTNIITELSNEVTVTVKKEEKEDNKDENNNNNNNDNNNNGNNNNNNNNNGNNNDNNNNSNNNNVNNNDNNGNNNNDNSDDNNNNNNNNNGLNTNKKFDLKIDKYVNKVTVKDTNGTYQYEFDNTNLAKVELDRKTINNTSIVVEYKILITNEGTEEGYVKKIVDKIPENLEFKSELNKDWYNNNGQLENISLEDKLIRSKRNKRNKISINKKYNIK